jgi:hypothetical protein
MRILRDGLVFCDPRDAHKVAGLPRQDPGWLSAVSRQVAMVAAAMSEEAMRLLAPGRSNLASRCT